MSRIGRRVWLRRFLNDVVAFVRRQLDEVQQILAASREGLEPRQRTTLDIGCCLVLGTLGIGLQLGRWSAWSVVVAAVGYVLWVLAYSEATVQAERRQRSD
jgi:hypothetical protein